MANQSLTIGRGENQAFGLGHYALDMIRGDYEGPSNAVLAKVEAFHRDSVVCGVSALAYKTNAPTILRREALGYPMDRAAGGVPMFGSRVTVAPEKAVLACSSAVREWDANGTNFGYNPALGATAGEFGHNDFYPVVIAAAQQAGFDGRQSLVAMAVLDEIRGRLAEVFALKNYSIDHVLHGAIASAAVYGAILGATPEQIESAIGLVVSHYVPFRAIRAGHQLSDSKGASAAFGAEMAVVSVRRAMAGFIGPADVFRNPQALFCLFEPPEKPETSPFDLTLATAGDDFAVMGMHFKLGLYEHQSAGAIEGLMRLMAQQPELAESLDDVRMIRITIYEPAFGIIGNPAKRNPTTRQSADHSLVYIVATLSRKANEALGEGWDGKDGWHRLMLMPEDYAGEDLAPTPEIARQWLAQPRIYALCHPQTIDLLERIELRHGGPEYDAKYPDGIPTTVEIDHAALGNLSSGLVMYPEGHARSTSGNLDSLLAHKFKMLAEPAVDDVTALAARFTNMKEKSAAEIAELYDFEIRGMQDSESADGRRSQ